MIAHWRDCVRYSDPAEARKRKCSASCYYNLKLYFQKYNPNMKRYDGKPSRPFNFGGKTG